MKQYIPKKPMKRGFKIWVAADTNGYFLDLQVFVGKAADGVTTEHGLGERVVLELTKPFREKWYHIYCDNFFTSPKLFQKLHTNGLYACGTVRKDRKGFPEDLKCLTQARGESSFHQCGNLVATVWQDKKEVYILSTCTDANANGKVCRRQLDGTRIEVPYPASIICYNRNMAGVDRGDQLRKYYSVRLKCKKNYKYIFWFVFDVAIINAFLLNKFCATTPTTLEESRLKHFRVKLAEQLIGNYNSPKRAGRPSLGEAQPPNHQVSGHFPRHQDTKRRCYYCQHRRRCPRLSESRWFCSQCEGTPTLCLTGKEDGSDCWSIWHSLAQREN